jgi:drug/metabolite transporter (DMT)-like permease
VALHNSTVSLNTSTILSISSFSHSQPAGRYYLGVFLATLSAIATASKLIARKRLIKMKVPYSAVNFQFNFVGFLFSFVYSLFRRVWLQESYPWRWMLIGGLPIGLVMIIVNTFYGKALKRENVQLLSILGSFDILYAVVLEYIFFKQTKSDFFFFGAVLIFTSTVLICADKYLSTKRENQQNNMQLTLDEQIGKIQEDDRGSISSQ